MLNYVECGKILVWKQLRSFQVGYLVITVLIGIVVLLTASGQTSWMCRVMRIKFSWKKLVEIQILVNFLDFFMIDNFMDKRKVKNI